MKIFDYRVTLSKRLTLQTLLTSVIIIMIGAAGLRFHYNQMLDDRVQSLRVITELFQAYAKTLDERVRTGAMTKQAALSELAETAMAMRYNGGSDYIAIYTSEGVGVAGPDRRIIGKSLMDYTTSTVKILRSIMDIMKHSDTAVYAYNFTRPGREGENPQNRVRGAVQALESHDPGRRLYGRSLGRLLAACAHGPGFARGHRRLGHARLGFGGPRHHPAPQSSRRADAGPRGRRHRKSRFRARASGGGRSDGQDHGGVPSSPGREGRDGPDWHGKRRPRPSMPRRSTPDRAFEASAASLRHGVASAATQMEATAESMARNASRTSTRSTQVARPPRRPPRTSRRRYRHRGDGGDDLGDLRADGVILGDDREAAAEAQRTDSIVRELAEGRRGSEPSPA